MPFSEETSYSYTDCFTKVNVVQSGNTCLLYTSYLWNGLGLEEKGWKRLKKGDFKKKMKNGLTYQIWFDQMCIRDRCRSGWTAGNGQDCKGGIMDDI